MIIFRRSSDGVLPRRAKAELDTHVEAVAVPHGSRFEKNSWSWSSRETLHLPRVEPALSLLLPRARGPRLNTISSLVS